ncbi:hypothetical protein PoB_002076500 [Plakobranchus ocellatus]|uniref:Uncharacterized protein n=1 Tax=Plakobranchus ocellatus TaxID=259542 RepID=A0AAV3ZGI0_9GAST|nr:hypothetical protein PoB_002076500 [Plakobranchus ocellatus]
MLDQTVPTDREKLQMDKHWRQTHTQRAPNINSDLIALCFEATNKVLRKHGARNGFPRCNTSIPPCFWFPRGRSIPKMAAILLAPIES